MAYVIGDSCIACGNCKETCPVGAVSEGDIYSIDAGTCIECGACEMCIRDRDRDGHTSGAPVVVPTA